MVFPIALAALLAAAPLAWADLAWEKPVQEFHCSPADGELKVTYAFKNAGAQAVEITRVATSCGCCVTAPLDHKKLAPGEAGEIGVKFTFEGRRGEQKKTIAVTTSDGRQVALELRCWIEEVLTVNPALVFWRVGEPAEAKIVELLAAPNRRIVVTAVTSSNPHLHADLKVEQEGQRYLVTVQPTSTAQKEIAQLTVQTDFPTDAPKSYVIHARVK